MLKIARFFCFSCCLLGSLLFCCTNAQAHRVNIFAYQDGQQIHVKAGFSRSQPARNAEITVMQLDNEAILLTLRTDQNGNCSFPIPREASRFGLIIRVNAGEGHVKTWTMNKEEFDAAKPEASSQSQAEPQTPQSGPEHVASLPPNLRELLQSELARQLAPLRLELAETRQRIRFTDILGGLGWLVGLAGLFSAVLARRKPQA
ncbi:MAG: hypothetical protein K6G15_11155 [Desulfovibrio sp.]|nr:hypothetical protein [Desulfovibrio sp.]